MSDFSSLLELAAGLNVAYIAVDYSMGYTNIISEKLFEFSQKIEKSFEKSDSILCEKKSLENLKPIVINGKNIGIKIEDIKRKFEKLDTEIKTAKTNLNADMQKDCESKNFSSLSFCMFLFCIISLFLGGISANEKIKMFSSIFNIVIGILLLVYVIIGWTKNDNTYLWKIDYSKLTHSLSCFTIVVILSFIITFLTHYYYLNNLFVMDILRLEQIIYWFNIFFVIFPFLNFIVFAFIIKKKGRTISIKISNMATEIENKCNGVKKEAEKLINAYDFVKLELGEN